MPRYSNSVSPSLSMPRTLESMPADPETGFIESPQSNGFGVDAKNAFLKLMRDTKGDASITAMAEHLGFDPATVLRHIQVDKAFARQVQEAKTLFAHRVEGVLMSCALDPKKTLDRLAYLRAYMPEKYARMELMAPAAQVQITVTGNLKEKLGKIVDADVVESKNTQENTKTLDNQRKGT